MSRTVLLDRILSLTRWTFWVDGSLLWGAVLCIYPLPTRCTSHSPPVTKTKSIFRHSKMIDKIVPS